MPSQMNFNALRAFGSNGNPSPGALATFFETGTSTPITVYTDDSLATAHPTPLVADAQGVFPPVFTSGATAVKVNVTTAAGTTLDGYPIDPVQLISSTGSAASAVSFAPITGNPATNVQAAIQTLTTANNTALDLGGTSPYASAAQGTKADAALPASDVLDEDDFATDSDSKPPSQQSAKAYIGARGLVAVIQDEKTSGAAAQTLTASTWNVRDLTTLSLNRNTSVTLGTNQITMAVDGWLEWSAPGRDAFRTRLYNVTDASVVGVGQSVSTAGGTISMSTGGGPVEAGKVYRVEHNTNSTQPGGTAVSLGTEVYTRVRIFSY